MEYAIRFRTYPLLVGNLDFSRLAQLSRLTEEKSRRRDDWVLIVGVCLTAPALRWVSPGCGLVGDVAAAGEVKVCTRLSRNGPGSRLRRVFFGAGMSVSLRPGWAGVRLSESNLEG